MSIPRQPLIDYWRRLHEARGPDGLIAAYSAIYAPEIQWSGAHPIDDCAGREAVLRRVWHPLLRAIPDLERQDDVLLSGRWQDASWLAATGHYTGVFRAPWLGIAPTGGCITLRYGEFSRIENGAVAQCYTIFDIPDFMRQAGIWPLAPPLGAIDRVPGPAMQDGLRFGDAAPEDSARTLELVESMIAGLMRYDRRTLDSMEQYRYWHENFLWYGPAGIGTCRGQEDYRRVHQQPFLHAFPDRVGGNHKCRVADGPYAASTGWPSIRATHAGGGFLGLAPTGRQVTMRVMDFWRRDGDLLRENWVFIDLLDLLRQMGIDVLDRMAAAGTIDESGIRVVRA